MATIAANARAAAKVIFEVIRSPASTNHGKRGRPTLGQLDTVAELWTDVTHPPKWKAGALGVTTKFTRENLPFTNMIYTEMAFDHAIYYRAHGVPLARLPGAI
jgi:hypothetical protein